MFLLYNLDQKLQILGIKGHKIKDNDRNYFTP